jgi:flagellar biosynthesis/type III secretory pathway ATPase
LTSVTPAKGLERFFEALREVDPVRATGVVEQIVGLLIESKGPPAGVADFCEIRTRAGCSPATLWLRAGATRAWPCLPSFSAA